MEMSLDFDEDATFFDDDGTDFDPESSGSHEYREIILQQSVTMLAYMDKTAQNTTSAAEAVEPSMLLGFSANDFTILLGAVIGATALLFVILTAIIAWHCCRLKRRSDKGFCLDDSTSDESPLKSASLIHNQSLAYLGDNNNQVKTKVIGSKSDLCQSIISRSQSVPLKKENELSKAPLMAKASVKRRPVSQPVHLPLSFQPSSHSTRRSHSVHPHNCYRHLEEVDMPLILPSIPEVSFRSSETLHEVPPHVLYASCNALDGASVYSSLYTNIDPVTTMKTRSLPLWGRAKPRPLSTEDDINELYAKVNFSKKRKNRMRSDSAAAIAVNKSRSSYLTIPPTHKDTDSLVDNEAVVVYDERTAL